MPNNNTATVWDFGLAEMIEEESEIQPGQVTHFRKGLHSYMERQSPSWETPQGRITSRGPAAHMGRFILQPAI